MSTKRLRAPLAVMAAALLVQACGGAASTTTPPTGAPVSLTISYSEVYEGALPIWVTYEAGIFQKHGLNVDMQYIASSTAIAALLSGQTQVSQGGGSEALSANVGGADLVDVATLVPVYPYVFMSVPSVNSISDLKGKKVGVSKSGSQSDIATRIALNKEGLNPDKDLTIIAVGSSSNRTAALKSGAIQGGLDQMPFSLELEKLGLHQLFDMASLKLPTVNNGTIVKRSWLETHKDVMQRYVDSLVEGVAKMKKDKAFAIGVLEKYLKVTDQQELATTWDYATKNLFPSDPHATVGQFQDAVDILGAKNPKVKSYDLKQIVDDTFVKSAISRHLDK